MIVLQPVDVVEDGDRPRLDAAVSPSTVVSRLSTPGPEFEAKWPAVSKHLRSRLDAGENILIHCRGGVGRSGMIAARLLVESGVDAETAITQVRAAPERRHGNRSNGQGRDCDGQLDDAVT